MFGQVFRIFAVLTIVLTIIFIFLNKKQRLFLHQWVKIIAWGLLVGALMICVFEYWMIY
ncbi:protein MIGRI [Neisseria sp. Ec49-e6-T10]|uniref:protein MIGRI n=1 Tax=Neisseria sp. Ec49-e6-T10 TaxID=3140744 RepID=UPI003EB87EC5